jgi:hypothetical protein
LVPPDNIVPFLRYDGLLRHIPISDCIGDKGKSQPNSERKFHENDFLKKTLRYAQKAAGAFGKNDGAPSRRSVLMLQLLEGVTGA